MTSTPVSLKDLAEIVQDNSHSSQIDLKKVICLNTKAVKTTLIKNYENIEYSFRNLFRNSYRKFNDSEIKIEYDKKATVERDQVLSQVRNITSFFQTILDDYEQEIHTRKLVIQDTYTNPTDIELQIEVPQMNAIITLFEIGDNVQVLAENLWLAGVIDIESKQELTTEFSKKIQNLGRNASIKANSLMKIGTQFKELERNNQAQKAQNNKSEEQAIAS